MFDRVLNKPLNMSDMDTILVCFLFGNFGSGFVLSLLYCKLCWEDSKIPEIYFGINVISHVDTLNPVEYRKMKHLAKSSPIFAKRSVLMFGRVLNTPPNCSLQ